MSSRKKRSRKAKGVKKGRAREALYLIVFVSLTALTLLFLRDGFTGFVVRQIAVHTPAEQVWEMNAALPEIVVRTRIENITTADYPAAVWYDPQDALDDITRADGDEALLNDDKQLDVIFPEVSPGDTIALHIVGSSEAALVLCPLGTSCETGYGSISISGAGWYAIPLDLEAQISGFTIIADSAVRIDYLAASSNATAAWLDPHNRTADALTQDNKRITVQDDALFSVVFPTELHSGDIIALHLKSGDSGAVRLCSYGTFCAEDMGSVAYAGTEGWYNLTLLDAGSAFSIRFPDRIQLNRLYAYRVINNSYDMENRSYPPSSIIETADLTVPNLFQWDMLIPDEEINGQAIGYAYSADSGQSWHDIAEFNLSAIPNKTMRIRATLTSDGSVTPLLHAITLRYITQTIEEREYTIAAALNYRSGTSFDRDNDGIENLTGVVDFQVSADFSWAVDASALCTRYWIQPAGNDSSFICSGAASCCAFVELAPGLPNWNDPFHLFVGRYGAGRNNTVRAQVLSVDAASGDIFYSGWVNKTALFISAAPSCTPRWECAAYGQCINQVKRCTAVTDANSCGIPPISLNATCAPYTTYMERSEDIALYSFFNNENESLRVQIAQGRAAVEIEAEHVVNGTIAVANYTENVKDVSHILPALGRYVDIVADSATVRGILSAALVISYTDAEVAAAGLNESSLAIYYLNEGNERWEAVPSVVNTTGNYIIASLEHISFYGVFGKARTSAGAPETDTESDTESAAVSPASAAEPAHNTTEAAQTVGFQAPASEACSYGFTVDVPSPLSFVEERIQKIMITNTGCSVDKITVTVTDPLHLLTAREQSIAGIREGERATIILQANTSVPIRQEFPIQGFLTKSMEKRVQNYTAELMIAAEAGGESIMVKETAITAQLITPVSRQSLTSNRTAVFILLGVTIAIGIGMASWQLRMRRSPPQP
ncbi:hypothetical protein HY491_03320 [Candidatus Woesearchaeota archaeon]|nr:hypothetical protein [Candidatus Woesearchaeota archaeon]